jgi:tetratricopeptide (TPR) repeat protein
MSKRSRLTQVKTNEGSRHETFIGDAMKKQMRYFRTKSPSCEIGVKRPSVMPRAAMAAMAAMLSLLGNHMSGAESANELLEKAKPYERKFQANNALPLYLTAEKIEPQNPHILCRIARQYRYLMSDADVKAEKLRLGYIALNYSKRAAEAGPEDPEAQLAPAITLGKMLPYMSAKEQVTTSPQIKESVDKTLQINPRDDTAWHILGRWNRVLADINTVKRTLAGVLYGGLPKGSLDEAERDMQKAIELNPHRLMHYIELGRIYFQMGKKEEARQYIQKGLAMPDSEKDDPETKQRGRETLEKL